MRPVQHRFNLFRKLPEDLQVHSRWGRILSCLSIALMFTLIYFELQAHLSPSMMLSNVVLDTHQEDQLQVHFNMTLHHTPCRFVQLDVSDHMGPVFHNVTKHLRLWRMTVVDYHDPVSNHPRSIIDDDPTHARIQMTQLEEQTRDHDPRDYFNIHTGHVGEHISTELDVDSFQEFMQKYDLVMVNFYVPWCPYCQALNPIWEATAGQILEHPEFAETVKFARVDCTKDKAKRLCTRARISAYPSILIYAQGSTRTRYLYGGPRSPLALMTFLEMFYGQVLHREDLSFMETAATTSSLLSKELEAVIIREGAGEGCRVVGQLGVHRVPGTIRLTLSSDAHSFDRGGIDLSHSVHTFGFGSPASSSSEEQSLSRQQFLADNWNLTMEHYMKIVGLDRYRRQPEEDSSTNVGNLHGLSTSFPHERLYRYSSHSNQYNATGEVPSIYFTYDISPLVIQEKPKIVPMYHFLTNLCAIVGGTVTILGIVESSFFHLSTALIQKIQLGKHE